MRRSRLKDLASRSADRFTEIKVNRLSLSSLIPIGKYKGWSVQNMIALDGITPCRLTMEVLLFHLKNGSYELTKPAMDYFGEMTTKLIELEKSGYLGTINKLNRKYKDII